MTDHAYRIYQAVEGDWRIAFNPSGLCVKGFGSRNEAENATQRLSEGLVWQPAIGRHHGFWRRLEG